MKVMRGIFSFCILLFLTAACGNQQRQPDVVMPASGSGYSKYNLSPAIQCSDDPNIEVLPGNSGQEYRACNPDRAGTLKLYPALGQSETLCVFPATGGLPLLNGTGKSAKPIAKCGTLSASGNSISFTGLSFDAIYVVKYERYLEMAACLGTAHPAACAASKGFFYAYGLLK
jgi:hypothetical protein